MPKVISAPVLGLSLGLLLSSCMTSPSNHEELRSTSSQVAFTGFTGGPNSPIEVRASSSPTGPFLPFEGNTTTGSDVPLPTEAGDFYIFHFRGHIPGDRWTTECAKRMTYLTGRSNGITLQTFEENGLTCLSETIAETGNIVTALDTCRSPDSPVVQVVADGPAHRGHVVIHEPSDAHPFLCTNSIRGDLTVDLSLPGVVELPNLEFVNGDVTLVLPIQLEWDYRDERCGESPSHTKSSKVDLSNLEHISGDLAIVVPTIGDVGLEYSGIEVGMNALTRLDGSLHFESEMPVPNPCGLSALERIPENLVISVDGSGDYSTSDFLVHLERVGGNVTVEGGHGPSDVLDALESVGGTVEVKEIHDFRGILWGLAFANRLVLRDTDFSGLFGPKRPGSPAIVTNALELYSNSALTDLGGTDYVRLRPEASLVLGSGDEINASLTEEIICEFVDAQVAGGWQPAALPVNCIDDLTVGE